MKKLLLLLILSGFQVTYANPNHNIEQAVFGTTPQQQRSKNIDGKELKRLFKAAQDGNIAAADTIKNAANAGNRNAALSYGYLAHTGKLPTIGTNYAKAMQAYKKAAKQKNQQGQDVSFYGNHLAAYNIGIMYINGQGVSKNAQEAYRWFQIALDAYQETSHNGSHFYPAVVHIAKMLETGKGTARNDKEAIKMWKLAANDNIPDAMLAYAKLAMTGRGTPQNIAIGINYLNRAAEKWNTEAMLLLAKIYEKGDNLSRQADPKITAKWLLILSSIDRRYRGKANTALAKLNKQDQITVRKAVTTFLSTHSNIPEPFDYNKPLYQNPRKP